MPLPDIQIRLLVLGILPSTVLAVAIGFYLIQLHNTELENNLSEKAQIYLNHIALSSSHAVYHNDTAYLNIISKEIFEEPEIVKLEIHDLSGIRLIKHAVPDMPDEEQLVHLEQPILIINTKPADIDEPKNDPDINKRTTKKIGSARITVSLFKTKLRQKNNLLFGSGIILSFITIAIIFIYLLSRKIIVPISQLTKSANDIANGKMNVRAVDSSITEIDDLCKSFNAMAIGLQNTQNDLVQQIDFAVNELNEALSTLEKKNKTLEHSTRQAIAENKNKSQFLAHISHEIRTPMNGILGFIELLNQSRLDLEQTDQLNLINSSATSLMNIVNELLDYSVMETGHFKTRISLVNIRECIENSVIILASSNQKNDIIIDIDSNVPDYITTDPIRLQQIVTNLVGNACKFSMQGQIVIRCRYLYKEFLFISISDNGLGIKNKKLTDLFQPFTQRLEYVINQESGTGLGLSISKNIIQQLGGEIGVISQHNIGSTFWLQLPCTAKYKKTAKNAQTIIVIDTNKIRRQAFTKQILGLGYTCHSFSDIDNFLTQSELEYDLVFLNHKYELKERIKKLKKQMKIIYLLSYSKKCSDYSIALPCRSSYLNNFIMQFSPEHQTYDSELISSHEKSNKHSNSILIADDNEINRLLIKSQLEPLCENISLAEDGNQARVMLLEHPYNLIFLDLQMPFFNGLEIIKLIRLAGSINKDTPIIAITAHAQPNQRTKLIKAGFDECLIKPILRDELKDITELWLSKTTDQNSVETPLNYIQALLSKTNDNKELTKTLFKTLFSEIPLQIQSIESAKSKNDYISIERTVHQIHGSVSFCGFTTLKKTANQMECYLVSKQFTDFETEYNQFITIFKQFVKLEHEILQKLETI